MLAGLQSLDLHRSPALEEWALEEWAWGPEEWAWAWAPEESVWAPEELAWAVEVELGALHRW